MTIVTRGGSISLATRRSLVEGLSRMDAADAELIWASDFSQAIRELTNDATYDSKRLTGTVGAKTVRTQSGPVIVVNANLVADRRPSDIARLAGHEAGHVHLFNRHETTLDEYRPAGCTYYDWLLMSLGGLAAEEFRIERQLAELGFQATETFGPVNVMPVLKKANKRTIIALTAKENDDPERLRNSIIRILDDITKYLSLMAAAAVSSPQQVDVPAIHERSADWRDYVATTWPLRLNTLATLPGALTAMPKDAWPNSMLAIRDLEQAFLNSWGFFFSHDQNGEAFWRRQDMEDAWGARLRRARSLF